MNKRHISLLFVFLVIFSCFPLCSCGGMYASKEFFAMDTFFEIKIDGGYGNKEKAFDVCEKRIRYLDGLFSPGIPTSDVCRINAADGGIDISGISEETLELIKISESVSKIYDGFDITLAPYTELWRECERRQSPPTGEELEKISKYTGYEKIHVSDGLVRKDFAETKIDLGAVAKGYAVDEIVKCLKDSGVGYGVVSAGSCVAVFGTKKDGKPFRIGIKDPFDTSRLTGYVNMTKGVLSVSGDYERFVEINGKRYHHILSKETGYPVNNGVHGVTVVCENGAFADALSTAVFTEGYYGIMSDCLPDFGVCIVSDGGIKISDNLGECFEFAD